MESFWRNSGGTVKFIFIDSRAAIFLIIFLFSVSVKTFILCLLGVSILSILEFKGYTIPNALRKLKITLFGNYKASVTTKRMSRPDR